MSADRIRSLLSTALVALVAGSLAGLTTSALAQEPEPAPEPERVFETAGLNADKVDGRHAVKYTTTKSRRAGKLVATNSKGFLPSNIVKPKWGLMVGVPPGFADGVDNVGVKGVTVTVETATGTVPAGDLGSAHVECPSGYRVIAGGFSQSSHADLRITDSLPYSEVGWWVGAKNLGTVSRGIAAYAVCMSATK